MDVVLGTCAGRVKLFVYPLQILDVWFDFFTYRWLFTLRHATRIWISNNETLGVPAGEGTIFGHFGDPNGRRY